MPSLSRGQENSASELNWFITVNGILTDMYLVEYRIFDITAGTPGTQIFPVVEGNYEDVTSGAGHFGTGSYYAYDNTAEAGWTPELTATVGTHRIEWRWKTQVSAPYQGGYEDFEILVQSAGSSVDTYVSLLEVRAAGVPESLATDEEVLDSIATWQQFLDRACRQWFIPKTLTLKFDGTNSDTLHFGVPIVSIDYLKINGSSSNLDTDLYEVYNGTQYPDDRKNPRIKLVRNTIHRDIFAGHRGNLIFRKGRNNQELKGIFGYMEPDGSVPKLIRRALLKLVVEKLTKPLFVDASTGSQELNAAPPVVGAVIEEWTDGHTRKWAQHGGPTEVRAPGLIGITNDQEILDIVRLYKAPLGIATPAAWSFS